MIKKNIHFKNLDTNLDLTLKIDAKMNFVYGVNGSGKTTLSKSKDLDAKYVFNEEFIYNNVYIIENDGAKVNPNTKNNFSNLFIGENVVKLKKEQDLYEEILKMSKNKLKELQDCINSAFLRYKLGDVQNPLNNIFDDNFKYNFDMEFETQFKQFKSSKKIEQHIKNDEDFNTALKRLNNAENLKNLVEKINKIDLLNEYIFQTNTEVVDSINYSIANLEENKDLIKKLEDIARKKRVERKDFETVKAMLTLQEKSNLTSCLLCENENPRNGIEEWNIIINDRSIEQKLNLIRRLNNYLKETGRILEEKKLFYNVACKTIENIKIFYENIASVVKSIEDEKFEKLILPEIQKEELLIDTKIQLESAINYIIKDYVDNIIFCNSLNKMLTEKIDSIKKQIEIILINEADIHKDSINNILGQLGMSKEINVKIDKYGGSIKYVLELENGKINTLSDGQKHKLSLAVFLDSLKKYDLKNKIIVFDDPVVALDELSYHLFKTYIVHNLMTNDDTCPILLILTHNFSYLYIQTSNLICNDEMKDQTKIFRLTPSYIKEIELSLFKLDDFALFKKALLEIRYTDELIALSCLFNKIFREFLDLKLRLSGNVMIDDPKKEIFSLNFDNEKKQKLQENSTFICQCSKRSIPTIEEAKESFCKLSENIEILGFGEFINKEELNAVRSITETGFNTNNDVLFIIKEVEKILRSKNKKYNLYKDYLNHPRISFTKNVLATAMDKD